MRFRLKNPFEAKDSREMEIKWQESSCDDDCEGKPVGDYENCSRFGLEMFARYESKAGV